MNKNKLHLRPLALGLMLAMSSAAMAAGPGTVSLINTTGNTWTASIGNTPIGAGAFTDVYVFTPTANPGSSVWSSFVNTSFMSNGLVTFQSADMNGTPLITGAFVSPFDSSITYNFGTLNWTPVSGTLTLTIHGTNVSGGSYGGDVTLQMAPVPEPETYGMMIAGLGILAMLSRRRKH